MISLEVNNFGPIVSGRVQVKPLTVLVGPNNAGKSYLAILLYAIQNSVFGKFPRLLYRRRFSRSTKNVKLPPADITWFHNLIKNQGDASQNEMPPALAAAVDDVFEDFVKNLRESLSEEIKRCFASTIKDLSLRGADKGLQIRIEQNEPYLCLDFSLVEDKLRLKAKDWSFSDIRFTTRRMEGDPTHSVGELLEEFVSDNVLDLLPDFTRSVCYLPAARSGILQGHKLLTGSLLSRLPLAGIEEIEIPKLSGVVADFLGNLLVLERRKPFPEASKVGEFIAQEVCKGKISLKHGESKADYPEIFYESHGGEYPLPRTSSMVSEVAPIVLFLRHLVNRHSWLIIEEPEAHLHPDSQRTLARAIVRLIRSGITVIVTTHSDYFLQQISNFIQLSGMPDMRESLKYTPQEYLRATEVEALLFHSNEKGTKIQQLVVSDEEGIPEDEFSKITESIYDETVRLREHRLSQQT
jgi:predicted ATPase